MTKLIVHGCPWCDTIPKVLWHEEDNPPYPSKTKVTLRCPQGHGSVSVKGVLTEVKGSLSLLRKGRDAWNNRRTKATKHTMEFPVDE